MYLLILFLKLFSITSIPSLNIAKDVMYIGVENRIDISLNGAEAEDVFLKVSIGILRKLNDTTYIYLPQETDEEIKFKLYHKKIVCDIKLASLKALNKPTIKFENEVKGQIKKSNINQLGKLTMEYDVDYPEHLKAKIQQFGVIVANEQGMFLLSTNIRGEELDERTRKDLERLTHVKTIMINNISVVSNNNVRRLNISKTIEIID